MSVPQTPRMFGASTTAAEVIDGVDLHGRRAVVTGASSGIGVETARALAAAGADVALAVRDTDAGARVV
ncbi:SDR family NAD(P)-dependent oxidoreductase, partial [Streptomyces sp. GbtcB7]|uniref:SDR family NAD(P)-dependent oxidoreductase n=1 Tax=Streptomyces sp. GbtcB7 TaxID=2824752 RepID=UPI001C30AEDB